MKYAAIMNDGGRAAGRTGMGAVMGSKNIKAVAVFGSQKVPLADEDKFIEVAKEAHTIVKEAFNSEMFRQLGTGAYVDLAQEMGDMSNIYSTLGVFENASKISGSTMAETILVRNRACYECPIGCGRVVKIDEGKYKLPETDGPEYETLCAFRSLILNDNLEGLAYANYLCNIYGI